MFYEAGKPHGLPRDPFKSCVVPRPIGWITTLDEHGVVNLAPYSFFNGIAGDPPMVMYANNGAAPRGTKDTLANCERTGEFVANMATWELREQMNLSCAPVPPDADEVALAGLTAAPSRLVRPPRVAESPVALECTVHQIVDLPCDEAGGRNALVIGRVVGVHIEDRALTDGLVDIPRIKPIARMGYMDYAVVESVFTMARPSAEAALAAAPGSAERAN